MGAKNLALGALAGAGVAGLTVATGGTGTAALASAALAGSSTAVGTAAALSQADQAKAAADYNAKASEIEADQAQQEANALAQRQQAEVRRILARQRAEIGSSGFEATGTLAELQADTAAEGMRDARVFLYGGQMAKARGRQQSWLDRMQGRSAVQAGRIGAASSLLSGAYQGYALGTRRAGSTVPVYGPSNAARRGF